MLKRKQARRSDTLMALKYIAEQLLPLIFIILVIFGFDDIYISLLTIIAAAAHEAGHLFASWLLSSGAGMPRPCLFGFKIKQSASVSYKREIIILLCGPFVNLVLFFLIVLTKNLSCGYLSEFAYINLLTAICNLLPIESYDGYGVLSKLLMSFGLWRAEIILEYISLTLCAAITFISLYFIMRADTGYWIFGIFFLLLMSKLGKMLKYRISEI